MLFILKNNNNIQWLVNQCNNEQHTSGEAELKTDQNKKKQKNVRK